MIAPDRRTQALSSGNGNGVERTGADHTVMRELNRTLVLDTLRSSGPISRAAIAKKASLAKPTVSAIIEGLMEDGLVREIGLGASSVGGGRPPILLEFNERSQFVMGIHVGTRRTTLAIADAQGAELVRSQIATPRTKPAAALKQIAREGLALLKSSGTPRHLLAAVGVVLPGLTDARRGVCVLAPNLGWKDVPVRDLLTAHLNAPILVHHLGQAAAVAEFLEGAGRGSEDLVLIYAGSGLGAGIVTAGHVLSGFGGLAGEIGHCSVPGLTETCSCGKIGCLETAASSRGLVRFIELAVDAGRETVLAGVTGQSTQSLTVAVAEAAHAGDEVAREAIAYVGRHTGLGASYLVNVLNPGVLVLAGGLVELGERFTTEVRTAVHELALGPVRDRVEIRVSELGQDAEVRGALLLALQQSQAYFRFLFQGAWGSSRPSPPTGSSRGAVSPLSSQLT